MNLTAVNSNNAKSGYDMPSENLIKFSETSGIMQEKSSQFAAALIHEIRNPLTNINMAIEILKNLIREDEQKQYFDIIMRSSGRINSIVNNLLVPTLAGEMQPEEHSVHQLLDEVLAMTGDRIMLKNIGVRRSYAAQDDTIIFDRPKMKIALTNIIINAIEAMSPEKGELTLITKTMNGNCIISIEDNGIGISKENLKTIFKPYITNKPHGMGLGLATTLNILLLNKVSVKVQSEPGRGTKFSLLFKKNCSASVAKKNYLS